MHWALLWAMHRRLVGPLGVCHDEVFHVSVGLMCDLEHFIRPLVLLGSISPHYSIGP
jgi:hypothetical protein